jgi:hypothetical protein
MEIRPQKTPSRAGDMRGSGPGARRRKSAAFGPRKDVIIRMPIEVAAKLKIVAAHEEMTVTDFCLGAIVPQLQEALKKHGLEPLDRHSRGRRDNSLSS